MEGKNLVQRLHCNEKDFIFYLIERMEAVSVGFAKKIDCKVLRMDSPLKQRHFLGLYD
jgi:hypothetical protein